MSGHLSENDVVVIGGGVIGCATARELAGDHEVLVLEKGQIGGETTGQASGIINTPSSYHEYPSLGKHAISFFREYDGRGNFSFHERPRVQLTPPEMEAAVREIAAESKANGFSTQYLTAGEVEAEYPGIFDMADYAGAVEYQDAGWVDPYTYTTTLQEEAEALGATFRTGCEVEDVLVENGRVAGVRTEDGIHGAEYVVCAANWWTRELLEGIVELPIIPFRWQSVNLELDEPVDERYPICYDPVAQVYWRPELNGELHVGGGEVEVGEPGSIRHSTNEDFRQNVAHELKRRLHLNNPRIVGDDICEKGDSTTPDKWPIIDEPDDAPSGLIVSTGFHIGGIMTSPTAATAARSLITDEECPFPLEPFRLSRFESRSTDFEFQSLMASHTSFE